MKVTSLPESLHFSGVENNDYIPVKFFIILVVPFTFDLSISMVMG